MFLDENLGHLTLIVEKQHLNYLSVGSISLHNLGTFVTFVEPYFMSDSEQLERIYPCLLTYSDLIYPIRVILSIHNVKMCSLSPFGYVFFLEMRIHEINRAWAFHNFIRYFKIQTQLTN